MMIKNKKNLFLKLTLAITFLTLFLPLKSLAQTFNSNSYQIQWGNFNMTSGKKTSTNYILTDTVGQNAPGRFTNTGYILKSGFQYAYDQIYNLSFSIDDLDIDFDSLTPNVGNTQTNIITVSTPSGNGYEILNLEDHYLSNVDNNSTIPDTICDASDCDQTTSTPWINDSVYGFGFNAIGINSSGVATNIGTSNYFTDSTYFRQFANDSIGEVAQVFMSENSPTDEHSARVTYKINISSNQASGNYQNNINFIAVPKY